MQNPPDSEQMALEPRDDHDCGVPMSAVLTRRGLILGASALGVAGVGLVPSVAAHATAADLSAATDEFTVLRDRWCDIITGASAVETTKPEFVAALDLMARSVDYHRAKLSSATDRVFTDLDIVQTADSEPMVNTYYRLEDMAIAWYTPGQRYHRDATLLAETARGLEIVNRVVYYAGRAEFGAWYHWEIGASRALANCLLLLEGQLATTARDKYIAAIRHFVADPFYQYLDSAKKPSTGSNRVDLCQAALVEGIASRSPARIQRAADGLPPVCEYVTAGDGLYTDGSFVYHNGIAYNGTYGGVLVGGLAKLITLLKGSTWELTAPSIGNIFDVVDYAYPKLIFNGAMTDSVRGRAISRTSGDHGNGHAFIEHMLRLAPAADPAMAATWRSRCRGWLERDSYHSPYAGADVPRTALVSTLLNSAVVASPEPENSALFRNMDRAVHRRNGWAFGISMFSSRITTYESMSGENLKGFHTGAGMTYLYDGDAGQFSDGFWPTVNPYRLPGITVERKTIADGDARERSDNHWAGGVTVDDLYAVIGQNMNRPSSAMIAKKSWFCLDEYVVALGAGISCTSANRVETIVENRNLHVDGTNKLTVDGVEQPGTLGWTGTFAAPSWMHVGGVGGYIFPRRLAMTALREERTGSFSLIDASGSTTPITRRYLTLWHDHGATPSGDTYAYAVAPGATVQRTAEIGAAPGFQILANHSGLQGIRHYASGVTAINFWRAGTLGGITVNYPCAVIVREHARRLSVAVADPGRANVTIRMDIDAARYKVDSTTSDVTVARLNPYISLDIAAGAYGRPHRATFSTD